MKKFLFATLMVMMGICAQAQIVSSSSSRVVRIVEEKPAEPVNPFEPSYYVKGGFSVLTFSSEEDDSWMVPTFNSLLGYNLVFGYDKPFFQDTKNVPLRGCISWGIEAGLSSRGTEIVFDGVSNDFSGSIFKHSLIVNPKLIFKIGSPKFSWYYDAGAFLRFDYASSIDTSSELENLFAEWTDDQNVDAGISIGTGFWINRFEIGFNALWGFAPLFDAEDNFEVEGNTISAQFHIGWAF